MGILPSTSTNILIFLLKYASILPYVLVYTHTFSKDCMYIYFLIKETAMQAAAQKKPVINAPKWGSACSMSVHSPQTR